MDEIAIWSQMQVKPGQEEALEAFLTFSRSLIEKESGTTNFYALKAEGGVYNTFATFKDDAARQKHIHGEVPKALADKGRELFLYPMTILDTRILTAKTPTESNMHSLTNGCLLLNHEEQ